MTQPLDVENAQLLLPQEAEEMDVWSEQPPEVAEMNSLCFIHKFRNFIHHLTIKCNWYMHVDTCFKHLKRGESRTDGNCWMHIDGQIHTFTKLNEETLLFQLWCLHP
ncbi:hypothetical protein J3R82DRAFT_1766 [Butyriboletus roseoflavus]|nr:hypothetical protein J3R82DRAFT_1766 [Butyriboletus roseoflavus]